LNIATDAQLVHIRTVILNSVAAGTIDLHNQTDGLTIIGNVYNDTVIGSIGDDVITGGSGADSLQGGAGNDSFNEFIGADSVDGGTDNGGGPSSFSVGFLVTGLVGDLISISATSTDLNNATDA